MEEGRRYEMLQRSKSRWGGSPFVIIRHWGQPFRHWICSFPALLPPRHEQSTAPRRAFHAAAYQSPQSWGQVAATPDPLVSREGYSRCVVL